MDQAAAAARLTTDTLEEIVARLPDPALRRTFLGWRRVATAQEDVGRLLRG
ncbi:MAG: hypothetical protein ACHQ8D_11480 [Candidatus Rokuibacteriota bacterium]